MQVRTESEEARTAVTDQMKQKFEKVKRGKQRLRSVRTADTTLWQQTFFPAIPVLEPGIIIPLFWTGLKSFRRFVKCEFLLTWERGDITCGNDDRPDTAFPMTGRSQSQSFLSSSVPRYLTDRDPLLPAHLSLNSLHAIESRHTEVSVEVSLRTGCVTDS